MDSLILPTWKFFFFFLLINRVSFHPAHLQSIMGMVPLHKEKREYKLMLKLSLGTKRRERVALMQNCTGIVLELFWI